MQKISELNLVPFFIAVYEEKTISAAAMRLGVTQPAVSKNISKLRAIYNDKLFVRNGNHTSPTPVAREIYPHFWNIYKEFSSTLRNRKEFSARTSNRNFKIACVSAVSYQVATKIIQVINDLAPKVSIEFHPLYTNDYQSDLRQHKYDLVIDVPHKHLSGLRYKEISEEQLVVICSNDHPRITEKITEEDFTKEHHVVMTTWDSRKDMFYESRIHNFPERKVRYRVTEPLQMISAVGHSQLLGVSTASLAYQFVDTYPIRVLPFPFSPSKVSINLIWHPTREGDNGLTWLIKTIKSNYLWR